MVAITRWRRAMRALQLRPAQVERAVAQADDLVDVAAVVDRERRRLGVGQDLEPDDRQLDLAGGQVRVDVLRIAPGHPCRRALITSSERRRVGALVRLGCGVRVEDELHDARAVAQIDEDQPAVVAPAMHPAGHPGLGVRPLGGQLAAPGIAVAVGARRMLHSGRCPRRIVGITFRSSVSRCSPDSMSLSVATPFVADDRHPAGVDAIGVLELALERAAGQLDLGLQPGPARLARQLERPRACCPARRARRTDPPLPGGPQLAGGQQHPLDARRPAAGRAWAGRPAARSGRRSGRRRRPPDCAPRASLVNSNTVRV